MQRCSNMKATIKYKYPYNALSYRPNLIVSIASEVNNYLYEQESSTHIYSVTPIYENNEWSNSVGNIDFNLSISVNNTIKDGLVIEYLFYEGSGTILHDTSGNGNNGIINGATWIRLSNGKWSLYFDGVDDYVSMPDNLINNIFADNQNLPKYMTVEILFKPLNDIWALFGINGGNPPFSTTLDGYLPYIYSNSNYNIVFADWPGQNNILTTSITSSPKFYHLVEVITHTSNSVDILEGYVNGQFVGSQSMSIIGWQSTPYNYLGTAYTGGDWNNDGWQKLQGYITLVRIFNYAMSSSEVNMLYNLAKQILP